MVGGRYKVRGSRDRTLRSGGLSGTIPFDTGPDQGPW
jgi:hypothetical protein